MYRQEASWPPTPGSPEEEAGLVVALDVKTGKHRPIYGMGRHNHENSVPIPGYGQPVVFSGDDTFTSGPLTDPLNPAVKLAPAQSQLYSYIARSADKLLADKGDLWAFVSDTPGVKNYYDVAPGSGTEVSGHFIKVPKDIATGLNPDGSELKAADKGYPLPPTDGTWRLDLLRDRRPGPGIDGPQWVLEYWATSTTCSSSSGSRTSPPTSGPAWRTSSTSSTPGRGRTAAQSLDTNFRSTNGRVWKMVLDEEDPKKVTSMTVFVEETTIRSRRSARSTSRTTSSRRRPGCS